MDNDKAFSKKWRQLRYDTPDFEKFMAIYKERTYELYGFDGEAELRRYLTQYSYALDAGCGNGGKTAWYAKLNPHMVMYGVDLADSVLEARKRYRGIPNLLFEQKDILRVRPSAYFDLIICDQVLHHIKYPEKALRLFRSVLEPDGELWTYVYRKKSTPRELLDEHFRQSSYSHESLMKMSESLTDLGKMLQEDYPLRVHFPHIPEIGIRGGSLTLHEFVYYNFIKCYYNEKAGRLTSVLTNYDWYAPKIAYRYTEKEFLKMMREAGFKPVFLNTDMACISGRFKRR